MGSGVRSGSTGAVNGGSVADRRALQGETYLIYHDAKYMRKYGDLDMLPQELTPFGDAFLTDQLVGLQPHQYVTKKDLTLS